MRKNWSWIALGLCILVGGIIRVHFCQKSGIWTDEANSIIVAMGQTELSRDGFLIEKQFVQYRENWFTVKGWDDTLTMLDRRGSYAPAYYFFTNLTSRFFGLTGIRSLNVIFFVMAAFALFLISKDLGTGTRFTILALFALYPWDIAVGMQIKAYAMATAFTTWSCLALKELYEGGDKKWLWIYGVATAVGLLSHYYVWLMMTAHVLYFLFRFKIDKQLSKKICISMAISIAIGFIWFIFKALGHFKTARSFATGNNAEIGLEVTLSHTVNLLTSLLMPFNLSGGRSSVSFLSICLVIAALTITLLAFKSKNKLPPLVFLCCFVPPMAFHFLTKIDIVFWNRYYVMFVPLLWVAGGFGLQRASGFIKDSLRKPTGFAIAFSLITFMGGQTHSMLTSQGILDQYADWRAIARTLEPHVGENSLKVFCPGGTFLSYVFYEEKPATYTAFSDPENIPFERLKQGAFDEMWIILSWGFETRAEGFIQNLAANGWQNAETINAPKAVALKFIPEQTSIQPSPE